MGQVKLKKVKRKSKPMKFIEGVGMPGAGKTTHIKRIKGILEKENYHVEHVTAGGRNSPILKGDIFEFNAYSFNDMVNAVLKLQNGRYDFGLVDRGVYDHITYLHARYMNGDLTFEQYRNMRNYFGLFKKFQDSVIVFMIDPEEAIKRKNKPHKKDFYSILYESYRQEIPSIDIPCLKINGSESEEKNSKYILDFMKKLYY